MKFNTYIKAIIMAIAIFISSTLQAQNNGGHLKLEEMHSIYVRAMKSIKTPKCLAIADTLRREAIATGNKEMELYALFVPVKHEFLKENNFDRLDKAIAKLIKLAKEYNNETFLYNAVSHKMTYLTNHSYYKQAIEYQDEVLKYAKQHHHYYGIITGHISLGNLHRKQMQIVQAIDEYQQAIDGYRKYGFKHDMGVDYKRIVECYLIEWQFDNALKSAEKGLEMSKSVQSQCGLWGYKAFALFMLDRDEEFRAAYKKYKSHKDVSPDIMPFVARSVEAMKLFDEGKTEEADKLMQNANMGAFRLYAEIACNKRRNRLPDALKAMQRLNIELYGDSKNSFIADWARISSEISNNLADLDKQKAANKLSQLKILQTNLEIKNNDLELAHLKSEEQLALANAENNRMSYNNQLLTAKRLSSTLAQQELRRKSKEQEQKWQRATFFILLSLIAIITAFAYLYLRHTNKLTNQLKHTSKSLQGTLDNLHVANDRAQEADKMKTRFVRNMSHEIRTPLNAIVGFSQIISEMGDDMTEEERNDMAKAIANNSEILSTLINDILDLTSIESGKYVMKANAIDVEELCKEVMEKTKHWASKNVKLITDNRMVSGFTMTSDRQRIMQVLTNMLTNAMKNTTEGSITLSCYPDYNEGMLTFTVTDTGIGVTKDKQDAIFERFSKADQFKQGAGLGLYICRTIADKLGGYIDIDRNYTSGARFIFSIPLKRF